jgi:hypothetical protein
MKMLSRDPYTRRVARSRAIGILAAAALACAMLTAISLSDSPVGPEVPELTANQDRAPVLGEVAATASAAAPQDE